MSGRPPARVCVVVPTYNERENVVPLLEAIRAVRRPGDQLLFVDDSSPDGTQEPIKEAAARDEWVHLLSREAKKGIGSAYLDGFRHAIATLQADIILEMDADLQHPPGVIPALVMAIEAGADVAVASRYVPGGGSKGWGFWRRLISRGANWQARTFLGLNVRDCTSGFRAYRKAAAQKLLEAKLPASGFEFQVAALHALKTDMKMVEVPFVFEVRKAGKSKLKVRDVVKFFFFNLWAGLG